MVSLPSVVNEQVPVGLNPDPEDSSTLAPDTPTPPYPTPVVHSNNTFTGTVGMPFDNTGATTTIPQTNRIPETKTAVPPLEPNRIQHWLLRYLPAHLVDNPILNVSLGALIAGVLNILAFIFLLALINAAIPYTPANIHCKINKQPSITGWRLTLCIVCGARVTNTGTSTSNDSAPPDGGTAQGSTAIYAYQTIGTHTITVIARDGINQISQTSLSVNVMPPLPMPLYSTNRYFFWL